MKKKAPKMKRDTVCTIAFGVFFIMAILLTAVVYTLIYSTPLETFEGDYWQSGIVYQAYPRSILDAVPDVNGTGDLKGIKAKVQYFVELGVEIIWLNPIYESPMADFGYDISNYTAIDPIYGTMEDFEQLLDSLHKQNLKLVMDFVPNHSSDQHEWFQKSVQNDSKYKDYYVWFDPSGYDESGNPIPPNNWLSVFRGSAWEFNEDRQQFYLHQFLKEQPDLNFRNPDVVKEMEDVMYFWLNKGVDGFRIDAIKHLFEVEDVYNSDEAINPDSGVTDPTRYGYLYHNYTTNQPETFEALRRWREIAYHYKDTVLMAEVYDEDVNNVMAYYGSESRPLADFPFNFFMLEKLRNRSDVTGWNLKRCVDIWIDNIPDGKWPNWVLGNHDNGRVATRLGKDLVDAMNMYNLLLPGTAVTYYGEEIGMEDTWISYEDTLDPRGCHFPQEYETYSRDPARTPMQWDDSDFAGFTRGNSTWLPVNENFKEVNVIAQRTPQSHFQVYKDLARLRRKNTFLLGDTIYPLVGEHTFSFIRFLENEETYLLVINTSVEDRIVDLHADSNFQIPETGTVVIRSSGDDRYFTEPGEEVDLNQLEFLAGEGFVFLLPERPEDE